MLRGKIYIIKLYAQFKTRFSDVVARFELFSCPDHYFIVRATTQQSIPFCCCFSSWDWSSSSVAWSTGAQLIIFFCFRFPVVGGVV